jgi:hypothetical protein
VKLLLWKPSEVRAEDIKEAVLAPLEEMSSVSR